MITALAILGGVMAIILIAGDRRQTGPIILIAGGLLFWWASSIDWSK
jgi:hypothetical protein